MKRTVITFSACMVAATLAAGLLFSWLGLEIVSVKVRGDFAQAVKPLVENLPAKVTVKPNRQQIKNDLNRLSRNPDIVMSAVVSGDGKVIFARGAQKHEHVIWPLHVSYPLVREGAAVASLKVWPSPELFYRKIAHDMPVAAFALAAAFLFCVTLPWYLFLRYYLVIPLSRLRKFVDRIETDGGGMLEFGAASGQWHSLSMKMNRLKERIEDISATQNMLFSVSQTLTSHVDVSELCNVILDIVQKKFGDVPCAILMLGEDGFLRHTSYREYSPDFGRAIHLRPGEGHAGRAFQKCQTIAMNDTSEADPLTKPILEKEGLASFIHIPLMTESHCTGLLNVGSHEKNFFTPERIATLSTLAKYLSIGLRNAQLYERVQELNRHLETEVSTTTKELLQTNSRLIHKVREMKALSDIGAFAAAKVNLSEILEMTIEKIKELLNAQAAGVFLCDPSSGEIIPQPPFFGIKDRDFPTLRFNAEEVAVIRKVLSEGQSFVFNDPGMAKVSVPLLVNLMDVHSLALVPLRAGTKNIGVFGIANKFGAPFDKDDLRIVELIADRISGVIENVRLYQELERRLRDVTVLQEVSSAISSEPVWEKTLSAVVKTTTRAFEADLCALLFYDEKTDELVTQPGAYFTGGDEAVLIRIPVNDPNSVSAQVFRSGESFISMDASIDPGIRSQTARMWDVRSLILVPLRAENRVIGVLRLGKHQANRYTREDLRLATLIAHQAAIIIENAHLYDSLKDAKAELEQLNQMKNEFISMVSHELRTPLTSVKGFVKVVMQGEAGPVNEQQEKFLGIADESIDRLTVLISDLLDISRIESGQLHLRVSPVDPHDLVTTVLNDFRSEAEKKRLKLHAKIPQKFPLVMADRERLAQVFDNLILNAIKFTREEGNITVSGTDKGDFVVFSVADTGIGIAKKDQQKIFEKFYQVDSGPKRQSAGTGLGLAIARSIVEMHGGQIWVESEPGRGSDFQFVMPRAKIEIKDFRREPDQPPAS